MSTIPLLISPCPNDTFVFHAMIHGLVDCEGLTFDAQFLDIDTLNNSAQSGCEAIIKTSVAVLDNISAKYWILPTGGALGHGNGPLLVSRRKIYTDELHDAKIGIPGLYTSANRLMQILLPEATHKSRLLFSDIATAVADGELDAGVLIHEGRFTYQKQGLRLIADLGQLWDSAFGGLPIPLGAIVVSKSLDRSMASAIARVIRRSVLFAFEHPDLSASFTRSHAQELSPEVLQNHISYFVNDYTVDIGEVGRKAIATLLGYDSTQKLDIVEFDVD